MSDAFTRAAAASGAVLRRTYRIAGRAVRLEFAGPALIPRVTPALEHLRAPEVERPDLAVGLWDSASTGVEPPGSRWTDGDYVARGEVRHDLGDHVEIACSVASGTVHYRDRRAGVSLVWVRRPEQIVPWEVAAPIRPVLGWWAEEIGGQLAHGAAVGTPEGGVLLAGPGGSGKSTLAVACFRAGMLYAGDDYVLLSDPAAPRVSSLYCTAKLDPDHLRAALPDLCRHVASGPGLDHDKAILFLDGIDPDRLAADLPLRAIAVPRVSPEGRASLRRASAVEVLAALAPSSIFQLPGAGPRALGTLTEFVRRVPGFALDLGADLDENVRAVRRLLGPEGPDVR